MYKNVKLSNTEISCLSVICFNNKRFFLFKTNKNQYKFFSFPFHFSLKKKNNIVSFITKSLSQNAFNIYINSFLFWIRSMNKKFKQKLLLKGLGFRCFFSDDKSQLKFKIGYSHIISLDIPKSISSVVIEKSFLIFEGVDSVELGNFCRKIKNLKKIDV